MMFWRILRRLLRANPARLANVLLALGAGAAVSAALLNLKVDAERRLTSEFRAFGANVIIIPARHDEQIHAEVLDAAVLAAIPPLNERSQVDSAGFLYTVAGAAARGAAEPVPVVVAGSSGADLSRILPSARLVGRFTTQPVAGTTSCQLGEKVASFLSVHPGDTLALREEGREASCFVEEVRSFGSAGDNQVFVPLGLAQRLANLPGVISLVQLSVPGTAGSVERYIADLQKKLPQADVQGIRQFTETEAKLYEKIRGLLTATVALILVLTALCVMAAMTNAAMERRHDVGLMKAIGGPVNRVLRLFLAEAAILGVVGGILGAAAGIGLSVWLGKAVFGVAARPRLIVYPVTVALTILVAIAGAFPLRRLASVKPAVIFRGEG
jgi:putative ABC transport system permease protein